MLAIDSYLKRMTASPVGRFVHVGAGSGSVLETYARFEPSKVVLIEGDPEAAAALQRAARPHRWAQVIARASAREDGEVVWNRYNLPMLNGPVAAEVLSTRYPRLRHEAVTSVPGVAFSSLLRSVVDEAGDDGSTVLLLDVPGQESALLESLGDELSRLGGVIIRRCALPLPGAAAWPAVERQMRDRSFELVGHEFDGEPLWPIAVFRPDGRGHEVITLRAEVQSLKTRLARLDGDLAGCKAAAAQAATERAEQARALTIAKTEAGKLAAERAKLAQQLAEERVRQAEEITALSARLAQAETRATATGDLSSLRDHMDRLVKREGLNVIKQLEAFDSVRSVLGSEAILPEFHGWPVSADFAAHLLRLLQSKKFHLVIEFGSGTSTFIVAAALARHRNKGGDKHQVRQIAFEHLPEHLEVTRGRIRDLGLNAERIVHAAPLIPRKLSSGEAAPYYDCDAVLDAVRVERAEEPLDILVIVDGPPAATGPLARYPALDSLLRVFPRSRLCILLDDFYRPDEKMIVEKWKADLEGAGREFRVTTLNFEKGACQLDVAA